jgi:predicted regulator of Ras-like GTPase activity (Roadblock/LC7/MglB family)
MDIQLRLQTLSERVPGVEGCFLTDPEGIVVASIPEPTRGQELAALLALPLRELSSFGSRLLGGSTKAALLELERGSLVFVPLKGGYVLTLQMAPSANLGQALYEARKVGFALTQEIV